MTKYKTADNQLTELRTLLMDAYKHYVDTGGQIRCRDGEVVVYYADASDIIDSDCIDHAWIARPIAVYIYSYALGPHCGHLFCHTDVPKDEYLRDVHRGGYLYDSDDPLTAALVAVRDWQAWEISRVESDMFEDDI